MSDLELLGYARFIGIELPDEADLLYIAEEGIVAPLPPEWEAEEMNNDEIIYVNMRTGERTTEHPCDEHYRQLVIKERRKQGKAIHKPFQPPSGIGSVSHLNVQNNAPIDPLVKMEQQKKQKRL